MKMKTEEVCPARWRSIELFNIDTGAKQGCGIAPIGLRRGMKQAKTNKVSDSDAIPIEVYQHVGEIIARYIHHLIQKIWNAEEIP